MFRVASADEILWDVEEEHLDEAEFLIEVWSRALDMPHYDLRDLARGPERRAIAHLDALAVGGPEVAARLLQPLLGDPEAPPFRVAAALGALLMGGDWRVLESLDRGGVSDSRVSALTAVVALAPLSAFEGSLAAALEEADGGRSVYLLNMLAARGEDTGPGVVAGLSSSDPALARTAAEAVVRSDPLVHVASLEGAMRSSDSRVRRAAIRTGLVWGFHPAWELATRLAESPLEEPESLVWVASLGDGRHWPLLTSALDRAETRGVAIWALGFSGRRHAIELCLPYLEDEKLAGVAAEAIAAIVGVDTSDSVIWKPVSSESPDADVAAGSELPALADDDLEADLTPTVEDRLPAPNAAALRALCEARCAELSPDLRYLAGRVMTHACVIDALHSGSLRRRHTLAFELAVRTRGAQLVPTRAAAARQRAVLEAVTELPRLDFGASFEQMP